LSAQLTVPTSVGLAEPRDSQNPQRGDREDQRDSECDDPVVPHLGKVGWVDELTRQAVWATLHCLTGCLIGEVAGMALATWWGWGDLASIVLAIGLAFVFGYALTMTPVLRAGVGLRAAIGVALAADTLSIAVMELVDNAFILAVPGAMEAGLGDLLFWWPLLVGFVIAFFVTVPLNRMMISRGKGHAVVHQHHHSE
jgi:hypothetical protein